MISCSFRGRIFLSAPMFLSLFLFLFIPSFPCRAVEPLSNPLADSPNWNLLTKFQKKITHDHFEGLVREVYCTHGISTDFVRIEPDFACILIDQDAQNWFTLYFAKHDSAKRPPTA